MSEPPDGDVDVAEVVQLRPTGQVEDEQRPLHTGPLPKFCAHSRYTLDVEARRVYCRDCEREVPAFDVVHDMARDWERFIDRRKHAARAAKLAEDLLEETKRQERNAKARKRKRVRLELAELPEAMQVVRDLARMRIPPSMYDHEDEQVRAWLKPIARLVSRAHLAEFRVDREIEKTG